MPFHAPSLALSRTASFPFAPRLFSLHAPPLFPSRPVSFPFEPRLFSLRAPPLFPFTPRHLAFRRVSHLSPERAPRFRASLPRSPATARGPWPAPPAAAAGVVDKAAPAEPSDETVYYDCFDLKIVYERNR